MMRDATFARLCEMRGSVSICIESVDDQCVRVGLRHREKHPEQMFFGRIVRTPEELRESVIECLGAEIALRQHKEDSQ